MCNAPKELSEVEELSDFHHLQLSHPSSIVVKNGHLWYKDDASAPGSEKFVIFPLGEATMRSIFGRSSSSAHSSKGVPTTGTVRNEDNFFGITLTIPTSFLEAPLWQISGCLVIILAIFLQSTGVSAPRRSFVLVFWTAILAVVTIATQEATLVPLLSPIIYTRTSYPYFVVSSYRSRHERDVNPETALHHLQSLLLSFFLYGFGGSILSDLLMGLPVTALALLMPGAPRAPAETFPHQSRRTILITTILKPTPAILCSTRHLATSSPIILVSSSLLSLVVSL
jgi:hypothetical protein